MAEPRSLAARDRQALALVAEGHTAVAAARMLGVCERTVRRRLARAYATLGARTAAQAIHLAWLHGHFTRRIRGGGRG